jgi:hypothetical protein
MASARAEMGLPPLEAPTPFDENSFGLNYPIQYIMQTWSMLRNHGILPRAGGFNDQDARWIEDIMQINALYASVVEEIRPEAENRMTPINRFDRQPALSFEEAFLNGEQ